MMKKIAAFGLTAALAFAPMVALADDPAPAMTPAADAAPGAEMPMKHHMMKHHMMKHHMMKHSMMKHHMKMKKMDAPATDATPAPDAPK